MGEKILGTRMWPMKKNEVEETLKLIEKQKEGIVEFLEIENMYI